MKRANIRGFGIFSVAVAAAACGGASGNGRPGVLQASPFRDGTALVSGCRRTHRAASTPTPLVAVRESSTVALAVQGGRALAYAADEDDWAVHIVDVDARKELAAVALDGRPSQIMFLPDGRLAVLLRDRSQIAVMEPGEKPAVLEKRCTVDTAPEPVSLARTPDDTTLLVTSGWGHALAAFDAQTLTKSFEVSLPREPRAVVVSDDGAFAYVSHAVGARVSRVTLADARVLDIPLHQRDPQAESLKRDAQREMNELRRNGDEVPPELVDRLADIEKGEGASCQGFALAKSVDPGGRILAPQVLVDNGDPRQRAQGYGNDDSSTEVGDVAVIDASTATTIAASLERVPNNSEWGSDSAREVHKAECLLPRAATVDPTSRSLLVSCFGLDQVIAYDALAASPARAERRRWSVGWGPNGIAVDTAANRAIVWSQFDRALDIINLGDGRLADDRGLPPVPAERIAMAPNPRRKIAVAVALGRFLFHAAGDGRIARDGRACASCHPDGRDDSLVWATPDGPRRSIMLAGRVQGTAPYAWSGSESDLQVHLAATFERLNGAGGIKGIELEALTAYIESLAPPPSTPAARDGRTRRGAELFASADVGCSSCHGGAMATDNERHDVKSKTVADKSGEFNTPSLHLVSGTGPYFHDGRYKTLRDVLASGKDDMGHTSALSSEDLDALEAYLRTL